MGTPSKEYKQDLRYKILSACLTCHHMKNKRGGSLKCEVPITRCPKARVRKWRKELEELDEGM